jgi:DNA repair exonuclease SbcCD ATPase subunit
VNEFSYIDIFATKGFEYLLVILFFLVLVGFWSFLSRPKKEIQKAQAESAELRRLLDQQRERVDAEIAELRTQREQMQNSLLARFQVVEQKALAAWREAHSDAKADAPDLVRLLDWTLAERETLVQDRRRLDYLSDLVQWKASLYSKAGSDGAVVVEASGKAFGEGGTLRGAIDAARDLGGGQQKA